MAEEFCHLPQRSVRHCVTNAGQMHTPSHHRGYFSVPSRLDKALLVGLALGHFMMIIDVIQEACYKSASFGTVQDLSHKVSKVVICTDVHD